MGKGSGLGVKGIGLRVEDFLRLGFRVKDVDSGFWVEGFVFWVRVFGLRVEGLGLMVEG